MYNDTNLIIDCILMYQFFLACVLLSPLPFGANRAWSWSLFAVLFAICGIIFFIQVLFGQRTLHLSYKSVLGAGLLWCIPCLWMLVQSADVMPETWAHPFWKLTAETIALPVVSHISVDPNATYTALMRLMSYALVFGLSLQFNRESDKAQQTFKALAYAGFVYALYGIIVCIGQFDTILWFDKWVGQGVVTSTFVYRNAYATFAGLSLLAAMPLLFEAFKLSLKFGLSTNYGKEYFYEKLLIKGWFPLLMVLTVFSALLMSQSRGGFLSTLVGIISLLTVLILSHKVPQKKGLGFFVLALSVLAWLIFSRSFDILIDRLDALDVESKGRESVYTLLSHISSEQNHLGMGYGTFENSFRIYRDETIDGFYDKAHNTYLENIFELGQYQAYALFASIFWLALICLRGVWVRRRNWLYPALGVAASMLVGAHAFVDFSLQIPAIAYSYALMLGAAVAQSYPSINSGRTAGHSDQTTGQS